MLTFLEESVQGELLPCAWAAERYSDDDDDDLICTCFHCKLYNDYLKIDRFSNGVAWLSDSSICLPFMSSEVDDVLITRLFGCVQVNSLIT